MTQILVVDDDFAIVEMLTFALESEGYHVITASNGREGLAQLAHVPSLVLCDVMMPVMSGLEMCREMQMNPRYRSIPVLLMSAVIHYVSKVECHYTSIISKPFDLDALLSIVQRSINTDPPS